MHIRIYINMQLRACENVSQRQGQGLRLINDEKIKNKYEPARPQPGRTILDDSSR